METASSLKPWPVALNRKGIHQPIKFQSANIDWVFYKEEDAIILARFAKLFP